MMAAVCVLFLACSGDFRAGRPLQKENDRQEERASAEPKPDSAPEAPEPEMNNATEAENLEPNPVPSPEDSLETGSAPESGEIPEFSDVQAMTAGEILDTDGVPQDTLDSFFYSRELSEEIRQRISGISWQENEHISLEELRYLRVLHMGLDGETHVGELIVNQSIAEDILEIMLELYHQSYPIEKMILIDTYDGDDESSMSDNNTSAFNYREIAGSSRLSGHALGLAIDINPRYNPYVKHTSDGELLVSPLNGTEYADRSREFACKITEGDLCLRLFQEHGFTWGGSWNSVKDYQHFEK